MQKWFYSDDVHVSKDAKCETAKQQGRGKARRQSIIFFVPVNGSSSL